MNFTDCRIEKENDSLTLIGENGEEKKVDFYDIKDVFILNERQTSPIKIYHRFLMGVFLITFFFSTSYLSINFLDSGYLDEFPTIDKILFFIVLTYTIAVIIATSLMIYFGIFGEAKFISYFALKIIKTRKRKFFVVKRSRKEYKILLRGKKQREIFNAKAMEINSLLNR